MSVLGADIITRSAHFIGIKILGSYNIDNIKEGALGGFGGKLIINFSNVLSKLQIETLSKLGGNINRVISEVLEKYGEK